MSLLIAFLLSFAIAEPLSEGKLSRMKFADNGVFTPQAEARHALGAVGSNMAGYGLSYTRPRDARRTWWGAITYAGYRPLVTGIHMNEPDTVMGSAKQSVRVQAGHDYVWNPLAFRYWVFLGGAGVGAQTTRYSGTIYRQECDTPNFCRLYDPRAFNERATYAFVYGKAGIGVQGYRIAGQPSGLAITLTPELARTGRAPRALSRSIQEQNTTLLIEANLEL